jgi:hypothetical protein
MRNDTILGSKNELSSSHNGIRGAVQTQLTDKACARRREIGEERMRRAPLVRLGRRAARRCTWHSSRDAQARQTRIWLPVCCLGLLWYLAHSVPGLQHCCEFAGRASDVEPQVNPQHCPPLGPTMLHTRCFPPTPLCARPLLCPQASPASYLGFRSTRMTESPLKNILLMNRSRLTGRPPLAPRPRFGICDRRAEQGRGRRYCQRWSAAEVCLCWCSCWCAHTHDI